MFHANAWGTPYGGFMTGADLVMPQQFLQAEPLAAIIARHRPTLSAGVPTIWSDLLRYAQTHPVDLSSLRMITAGGAAVPRQLIERFRDELGVELVQGWGMTETSPLCSLALPPRGTPPDEEIEWRSKTGRVVPGVEVRVAAEDGSILPNDGESVGEFEVRGPWITGSYYGDPAPERFHDGWLRTGDIGSLDRRGFMQISDRTKDVIKSGRRVDLLGRAGERGHGPSRGGRGRGHRRARRAVERAAPGGRGGGGGLDPVRRRAGRVPERSGEPVVAARAVGLHRRGAEDQRREVRQEGAPVPARRRRASRSSRSRSRAAADPWPPILPTSPTACPESARSWPTWPSTGCARPPTRCGRGANPIPAVTAEEKRITRARRSVEKAVQLLAGPSSAAGFDEGP